MRQADEQVEYSAAVSTADMESHSSPTTEQRFYQEFGRALRQAREDARLTQEALGQTVGLSRTSITNIERGIQPVAIHTLLRLSRAVHKEPAELLPGQLETSDLEALDPTLLDRSLKGGAVEDWVNRVVASRSPVKR
jgi:transcriptional regulator with XRE-family HTH domain